MGGGDVYFDKAVRTLELLPDLRWWTDAVMKPPVLQRAWRVKETGEVEWRDVPLHYEPAVPSASMTR
jgi:hypothetical protein